MDKIHHSTGKDDWETPEEIFQKPNKEFKFTMGPCASDSNHKCKKYYTKTRDGLKQDWRGETVFCNPAPFPSMVVIFR